MNFVVLIPARRSSTRLPDKALADIAGLPMVVRAAQVGTRCGASRVAVATDDEQIAAVVRRAGIEAVMTEVSHQSGTDRLAQACEILGLADDEIVVNLQGDEPLMPPSVCEQVARCLADHPHDVMATAVHAITSAQNLADPNIVKAVLSNDRRALYFSRAPVPFRRDHHGAELPPPEPGLHWHHVGIYAYRASFLARYVRLPASPLEQIESLEQLRVLAHGYSIRVVTLDAAPPRGVDTPEDLARVRAVLDGGTPPAPPREFGAD